MTDRSVHRGRKPVISREQVLEAAAATLENGGAETISLRAIARELGVVSSAIYRHYPSRDALLTDLIVQAHTELGEWVSGAEHSVDRAQLGDRFGVVVRSAREWAKRNPHRYALIYGTPVPGYSVPASTLQPASIIAMLFARLLLDAAAAGCRPPPDAARDALAPSFSRLGEQLELPPALHPSLVAGVQVWSQLFGHISFEIFGHYVGVVDDVDAYTEALIVLMAARLGLPETGVPPAVPPAAGSSSGH
ncbi:TetR/AcrR family transcriptional regulator [Planctomonas sp. JC2975]|uniref:WHG domain-containing protein n=1 Tax=Planctomonas sp. JC2975 TaxID=2729626 RepID=UPI0014740F94|nr:TetR/AcrR family transcriptional regulator [Planctomonas sp. JC2975]